MGLLNNVTRALTARRELRVADELVRASVLAFADTINGPCFAAHGLECDQTDAMVRMLLRVDRRQQAVWLVEAHSFGDERGMKHYIECDDVFGHEGLRALAAGAYVAGLR